MREFFEKLYKGDDVTLYARLRERLLNHQKTMVVTANPEILMKASQDETMRQALMNESTWITPDGEGVVHATKQLGYHLWGKIAGVETVEKLFEIGNEEELGLYIYGSKQEVLDALAEKLKIRYPHLKILGLKNGYTNHDDEVASDMLAKQPDIVLTALGVPRQELFIWKYFHQFDQGVFVGCGGSLDVLSGTKKRAPRIFIRLKLEWLYRIASEPSRLKRFYDSNIKFLFEIRKLKKKGM